MKLKFGLLALFLFIAGSMFAQVTIKGVCNG